MVLDGGDRVAARSVILASGVSWRQLDVPGADALVGRGIYYGAARTEAMNCQGQHVFLVGGGNSAGQAAMFFANYAHKVSLLVRGPSLAQTMSHYLIQQLATKRNIEICTRCRIVRVEGEHHLEAVVVEHRDTGELVTEAASAVFVFIGADAQTDWLPAPMIRDENGYVCTGRDVMDLVAGQQGPVAARARPVPARDQHSGHLRRRRRAPRFGQARRIGRGRRQHGDRVRAPVPGRALRSRRRSGRTDAMPDRHRR